MTLEHDTPHDSYVWLTVKEYAALRRVHVQTVYTAIRLRRLKHPIDYVGRAIRIGVPRESIQGHTAA